MSDYWMPPTCPDCHGTLDSDDNHWASGKQECTVTPQEEEAAVRVMLELGIAPAEVASMTMDARRRRAA